MMYFSNLQLMFLRKTLSTVDEINKKFVGRVFATSSGFGNFDLILPHVNKAVGLEKMLASWNLTLDDLVAFGDGEMI